MDELDQQILNALQQDFPLSERPFDVIATRLGIDVDVLWDRVQRMCGDGTIRRIGASLDSRRLGFSSTLAAVHVKAEDVERAAATIARYPEITHSYLRDHRFNIWFTIIAPEVQRIQAILEEIRTDLGLGAGDVLNLPMTRLFKLDARFKARP
jgi:DNA-binding Lrp family transcriptional regulator